MRSCRFACDFRRRVAMVLFGLGVCGPGAAPAASWFYGDFSEGLGADFTFDDAQGVFALSPGSSGLRMSKNDGTGTGFTKAAVEWGLTLVGDFTADVDYRLHQPLADFQQLEWRVTTATGPFFQLVRSNEGWLGGNNYHVWNGSAQGTVGTTDSSGTLRIARVGTAIDAWYKPPGASGFSHLFGQTFPTEELHLLMTLQNQPETAASLDATFGNIRISVAAPVPAPPAWMLISAGLVVLAGSSRRVRRRFGCARVAVGA